jgi:hypothetical protein
VQTEAVVIVVQFKGGTKVAVTERDEIIVMEQAPVPAQEPDQPMNAAVLEVAYIETIVPWLYVAEHVGPQSIPAGFDVTVPMPALAPALLAESACRKSVKVALTLLAAVTVTVQGVVPMQPLPDHPVNVEPVLGDAVNVTSWP